MKRSRLLLAVPAATALVFTGMSPAVAGGDDGHGRDDNWAEVISIDDTATADGDAEYVDVSFDYKCEDDDGKDDENDFVAKVTLKQGDDVRYEGEYDDLTCDGEEQTAEDVRLDKESDDAVENGEAWVTVRIVDADGETLDRKRESVEVEGVDEDDHGKRHHDDGDKDHHDKGH